ncbi:MAG: hypothetical protein GYB68_08885 [Chloroflexi bacterium]|nr:hypothetical protein [Chloroflexota bacterium]
MAWIPPSQRNTGDLISASIWNQDVVENAIALRDGLSAQISGSSAQVVANGAISELSFTVSNFDNASLADLGNNQLLCPTAGIYLVTASARFTTAANALYCTLRLLLDGAYVVAGSSAVPHNNGEHKWISLTTLVSCSANATLGLRAYAFGADYTFHERLLSASFVGRGQ